MIGNQKSVSDEEVVADGERGANGNSEECKEMEMSQLTSQRLLFV